MAARHIKKSLLQMDKTKNTGFTMIEIVITLVVIGILSAAVVSRINIVKKTDLYTFSAALKAGLRYAQMNAMATETICSIEFSSSTYTYKDGNNTEQMLPGQDQILVTAPEDVTMSVTAPLIAFDSWGRPGTAKTDDNGDGLLDTSAGNQITISNSEDSRTLIIIQETGYITVQ